MKKIISILLLIPFITYTQTTQYELYIQSDINEWIPARMSITNSEIEPILTIINAEEKIQLKPSAIRNDTLFYHFIDYNAVIALKKGENDIYSGYWINNESSISKKRLIIAFSKVIHEEKSVSVNETSNHYKATIIDNGREIPALLIFNRKGNEVGGTIRTNSGDYRYLQGKIDGLHFYLSTFAGNSAFYLEGEIKGDSIVGNFHDLRSNDTKFKAVLDNQYDLQSNETLTKVINDKPFNLDLKDQNGNPQKFYELIKGKVAIVSIFGTWCPNCVDETNYFNTVLLKKYPDLKIISVAYEGTDNIVEQQQRVQGFIKRKNIQGIQFLIAKKASGKNVMENFPMIDKFSGYPTSFLIDKKGKIVGIHTGFNGPATGMLYQQYQDHLEAKIKKLIK